MYTRHTFGDMDSNFGIQELLTNEMSEYIRHWLDDDKGAPAAQREAPGVVRVPKKWSYREAVRPSHLSQSTTQSRRIAQINAIARDCENAGDRLHQGDRENADAFISAQRIVFTVEVADSQRHRRYIKGLVNDIAPELIGGAVNQMGQKRLRDNIIELKLTDYHTGNDSIFRTIYHHIKTLMLNVRLNVYNATRGGADRATAVADAIESAHELTKIYALQYKRSITFQVLEPPK